MSIEQPEMLDVIIVGGGLSGLLIAREIDRMERSWTLLEARSTLGGRLENDDQGNQIDLGGAWIWPRHQPKIKQLVDSLGDVQTFVQPDDPTSMRIQGGAVEIVKRLATDLPPDLVKVDSPVVTCKQTLQEESTCSSGPFVTLETASGQKIRGRRVVFAAPPKALSMHVQFDPPLEESKRRAMARSQTWMAGVTKVSLVYKERFWPLEESNMGFRPENNRPAFQVYDGSPVDKSIFAMTFFTLSAFSDRAGDDDALASQCALQMGSALSFMGPDITQQVSNYVAFHVKRWPLEKYISEDPNPRTVNPHPAPVQELAENAWDNMLLFAGTETDLSSPGVMEGAVGAALRVVEELKQLWK